MLKKKRLYIIKCIKEDLNNKNLIIIDIQILNSTVIIIIIKDT